MNLAYKANKAKSFIYNEFDIVVIIYHLCLLKMTWEEDLHMKLHLQYLKESQLDYFF